MTAELKITIDGWSDGSPIPGKYAFCIPDDSGKCTLGNNLSPAISWSGAPEGTKSFAVICHDPDVPSVADDVNQDGRTISADLPRVDFYHWVLVDIDAERTSLPEGADSNEAVARGKTGGKTEYGVRGVNNYTDFMAGDADMAGTYTGYDGPCPPWNDSIVHHYHFTVYALDVDTLGLEGDFTGPDALAAMEGHVLAKGSFMGTYSLNPDVPA